MSNHSKILVFSYRSGCEVTLTGPVEISNSIDVVNDLTINLNGHTITYIGATTMFNVKNSATLTINGNNIASSSVNAYSETVIAKYIARVSTGSNIILNGGNHITKGSTLYNTTGGSIVVNSGKFKADGELKNLFTGDSNYISVNTGSFYKWDPSANNATENITLEYTAEKIQFLAKFSDTREAFKIEVEKVSGEVIWYNVKKQFIVSNAGDFNIGIGGSSDIIANDDIIYNNMFQINNAGDVNIDLNGNTFQGYVGSDTSSGGYSGVVINNSNLTVSNGTFTGGGFQVGYPGSQLTLNNCNISITSANTSMRYCIYAVDGAVVRFNGGTLSFDSWDNTDKRRVYFYAASGAIIYVTDCVCGPPSGHPDTKNTPIIESGTGQVIITGGTFGFDPSTWVADGYETVQSGSTWIVQAIEPAGGEGSES